MFISLMLMLSCQRDSTPNTSTQTSTTTTKRPNKQFKNLDEGQKHPPIPADNPMWEWDAKDFVPDFGWFGEHSWMDVRMRVAGHLSAAGRDLARISAAKEQWMRAAQVYQKLYTQLKAIPTASKGTSKEINTLLITAANRDAQTLKAIAQNNPVPIPKGTIAPLRAEYFRTVRKYLQGKEVSSDLNGLQKRLKALQKERPELDITAFKDFHSRHQLRIALFQAYLDALDPLSIAERWGYWKADEINRQIDALGLACEQLGGSKWESAEEYPQPSGSPYLWPSHYLKYVRSTDQLLNGSVEEFGMLPTGDSLIDVASSPGPKAIGDLMKWGSTDKAHMQWLKTSSQLVLKELPDAPDRAVAQYQKHISYLSKASHGSKFYNVKQFRNATIRQLARAGHYKHAHRVLQDHFPLHHQDWACPNREGILLAIDGRLLALSGDSSAEAILEKALNVGDKFLSMVDEAESGLRTKPVPPQMRGQRRGHKPPPQRKR